MVARLPIMAATLIVSSISITTLLSIATPALAEEIITCESVNNQRTSCVIPTTDKVTLVRQLSNASCSGNWDYNRNRIWVKNGCRAEFSVGNFSHKRDRRHNR